MDFTIPAYKEEEFYRAGKIKINYSFPVSYEQKPELLIPVSIFRELSPLRAIVKYLREQNKLRIRDISKLLLRDPRTIWSTYNAVKDKKIEFSDSKIQIPVSIFQNSELSILEAVVTYLRDLNLRYNQIAALLNKNQRTIWTVYARAKRKIARENE